MSLVVHDVELDQLAERANRAHEAVGEALSSAIEHAISCGEALIEARARFEDGGWEAWAIQNLRFSVSSAGNYMRLAHYKDKLPPDVSAPYHDSRGNITWPGLHTALTYLRGLPPIRPRGSGPAIADVERDEIKRLKAEGLKASEIAGMVGRSESSVEHILYGNRQSKAERRRIGAARRERMREQRLWAKREKQRQAAMRAGGDLSEAYAALRRALDHAEGVREAAVKPDLRVAIEAALQAGYRMEDALGQAAAASIEPPAIGGRS